MTTESSLGHLPKGQWEFDGDVTQVFDDMGVINIGVPYLDAVGTHGDLRDCLNSHGHSVAFTADCLTTLLAMTGLSVISSRGSATRLRLFGVLGPRPRPPAKPLRAAEQAPRTYRERFAPDTARLPGWAPVRLRAGWLKRAYTAERLAYKSQKLTE